VAVGSGWMGGDTLHSLFATRSINVTNWSTFSYRHRAANIVGEMVYVISNPVVRVEVSLHMMQRAVNSVRVSASMLINEKDGMVDGEVRVSVGRDLPLRRPAVTDDRCTMALRRSPTSLRKWTPTSALANTKARKSLFATPSAPSVERP
jgi:hypothetical protein